MLAGRHTDGVDHNTNTMQPYRGGVKILAMCSNKRFVVIVVAIVRSNDLCNGCVVSMTCVVLQ